MRNLAIANPEHAPYGVAAKQALERADVHGDVEDRLVYGENISDTLRLAESGSADAAIVALPLAITSNGKWSLIPATCTSGSSRRLSSPPRATSERSARGSAAFVSGAKGREVMRKYGFLLPGDEAPAATSG